MFLSILVVQGLIKTKISVGGRFGAFFFFFQFQVFKVAQES